MVVKEESDVRFRLKVCRISVHTFNKSLKEYCSQKLKNDEDLIMKVSTTLFSQPVLKRKRYQEPVSANINASKVLLAVKDSLSHVPDNLRYTMESLGYREGLNHNQKVMVEALQILAAQPRKPNRSHWKQNFGHAPTVPINEVNNTEPLLQFKENDVLVTKNGLGGFNLLIRLIRYTVC